MLFSPYCREFNSLQKRYTALLHRTNTFAENKIIRSVVGGKVDGQILSGTRSEKSKILSGIRDEKRKIYFAPNEFQKKILAVKGLKQINNPISYFAISES